ncbi:MAG: XdhC family protein [Gemmatimonadetes bacterium]|nr:XdhC family protein [Gemmatimonadota bacterium]
MKHWREAALVLDRLAELQAAGTRAAIATLVRVHGSAYRRAGAKLLIAEDGSTVGNVSGGCLEQEVRGVGLRVLRTGRSELHGYCSGPDEIGSWNLGLGCDGRIEVLVTPAVETRSRQRELLDGEEPFAVCRLVTLGTEGGDAQLLVSADESEGALDTPVFDAAVVRHARELLGGTASAIHQIAGRDVFVELFFPPPELVVIGAADDAPPIARYALEAGFRVVVVDWRPGMLEPGRFGADVRLVESDAPRLAERLTLRSRSHVVLATHNYAVDEWYLRPLLQSPAPYIGILGPRARTERLLGSLGEEHTFDESRIHGPVGLDLGGEGAEQVALAIVAEILAVHAGRRGMSLRDRVRQPSLAFE